MPEPGVIRDYLAALSAHLPAPIVDELADGLQETLQHYLCQGLPPEEASRAAVAEFGEPQVVVASFARVNPARLTARRLLRVGPGVGACWAAALLTARAWTWHVPEPAFAVVGLALLTVIGLLAAAAVGTRYRFACHAAAAGCIGTGVLDATAAVGILLAAPVLTWPILLAAAASVARIVISAEAVRRSLAG
ncbi:MAG TPA: permease prefix domain 1-containing protein [Streptosporangiaceae bacterium]|nr:permease prefix domain 1-containing protein [Streptosporangiaceae bacterium]